METNGKTERATFAAGCFWGVEAAFAEIDGVVETAVGYTGGHTVNPSYKQVCYDNTGHAEAVEVKFAPAQISYEQLLDAFWRLHDPTTLNRQGPDVGSQYRSAIFFHTPEQQAIAEKSKRAADASGRFRRPIVTEVTPASKFYPAEDYHQRYFETRGARHCHVPDLVALGIQPAKSGRRCGGSGCGDRAAAGGRARGLDGTSSPHEMEQLMRE